MLRLHFAAGTRLRGKIQQRLEKKLRMFYVGILVLLAVATLFGCDGPPASGSLSTQESPGSGSNGPVLLLTFEALRADALGGGASSVTPNLDRFAERASWQGRAVAASSSPVTSLASLLTGVEAWQHQILSHRDIVVRPDRVSFPTALARSGYDVDVFLPRRHFARRLGLLSAEVEVHELDNLSVAIERASALQDAELLWIHVPHPGFPLADRSPLLPAMELPAIAKPERQLVLRQLMPYVDPAIPMPPALVDDVERLYQHDVAWADHLAGRILRAAEEGDGWSSATVVITALHGLELGEHGQALFAQNLGRETLEVPLMVKLPSTVRRPLEAEEPVSLSQLAATVLEAAGGEAAPALQPSLLRTSLSPPSPALSALYLGNGANLFSATARRDSRTIQLLWRASFAPHEAEFYAAQVVESGVLRYPITESPKRIWRRLDAEYSLALPLSGNESPGLERPTPAVAGDRIRLQLEEWTEEGKTRALENPELAAEMAAELRFHWSRFVDRERSPAAERDAWAGGYDD